MIDSLYAAVGVLLVRIASLDSASADTTADHVADLERTSVDVPISTIHLTTPAAAAGTIPMPTSTTTRMTS